MVLGIGDAALETGLREAATANPHSVAVRLAYDEALAHRIVAGADVLLVPSRFEPCGLTQLYALKYGTLPLVRRVGGLADTVVDCSLENLAEGIATGFVFERFDVSDYGGALRRAFALFQHKREWRKVQQRAMAQEAPPALRRSRQWCRWARGRRWALADCSAPTSAATLSASFSGSVAHCRAGDDAGSVHSADMRSS